jgi:hypothetical protein
MKKNLFLIAFAMLMFLFSCKKDDTSSPYDAAYTDESPEVSKANVEQNAIDLVDQLDAMTSATAIEVLLNLGNLNPGMPVKSAKSSPVMAPLMLISTINNKSSISSVLDGMRRSAELVSADPIAFSAMFDSIAGKYTYNFVSGEFDFTELADKIVFEFPGKETDLTNTAVITVDKFSVVEIAEMSNMLPTGSFSELPTSIRIDLKYNTVSIAGAQFNASYQSDGMPVKVAVSLYLDDFTFNTTLVHSPYSSASWTNTLKYQSDILLETYIAAKGNWSEENLNSADVNVQDIINNANAHVIVMNLMVAGQVNMKAIGDDLGALDVETMTQEEITQAEVDAINANAKLVVIYRDSNTKIAEAEAFVDSYYDAYYDETEYSVGMQFVYADSSAVDVETYVNGELDNFYESVNTFIDKMNTEYDLGLEYIGPPTK